MCVIFSNKDIYVFFGRDSKATSFKGKAFFLREVLVG